MLDKYNEEKLRELELKWMDGSITEEEAKLYAEWYNLDQNKSLNVPKEIASSKSEHKKLIFEKIEKLISNEFVESKNNKTAKIRYIKKYAVAASLLIIVSLIAILYKTKPTKQIVVNHTNDVQPGHNGLVLTLGNHKRIVLDSIKDGIIAIDNGIKIIKSNNMIYYQGQSLKGIYNTATTDKCRQYKVQLPDNSVVWLNAESSLHYPLIFEGNKRIVELSGEGYFEVAHDQSKPFIVKTALQNIEVLGTHFNIKAYKNDSSSTTTLLQGKVRVSTNITSNVLSPGQQAITSEYGKKIELSTLDTTLAIGWTKQKFIFRNADLNNVLKEFQRWYGVGIKYEKPLSDSVHFSGSTTMIQNLSDIVKIMELSGIHLKIENNNIIVL